MKRFLFQLIIVFVIFSVSESVMGQSFPFQTSPTGSYVPAPHIFQNSSTLIQKMGMHYSACELKMRASSKLGLITFSTSSTSGLNAGSVVNVYLDNSQYCDLRTWRSWTDVNDSIDAVGQAQLVIINATNFRLVFSSALANSFVYEGGGLDVFIEGLGQVSTETLSGFESAGNVGFWGLNLPVLGTNVIRPVMGGNYTLTTQNIPPTCIRTVTCSNQTQYCPGEIVCMYLKKQDGVFVNDGGLSFSWERTTTPCDAASWISVPASSSWSLQLAAPSLSGTYYYRCKITDGASLYYSSLSGTCSAAGCNDYFSITVIPALNTLGCYDEPDMESISLGARISEVEMKVNGALLLKSNTNFVNGTCTSGADFYSVYARPNSGSSLTSIIEAPIISPTISWMDFSDALSSTVVPEVHPGDLIDFKVRMSNCDKPQLFNHAVRLEFDWDNNQTFETLYDFSFLEATPILSYYQGFPESLLLNPMDADSVVYQKSFTVPCDIVCGNNVVTKFRVSLKRLPTGWGDAEDYAIKSLCNDVTINFSGSNTICQGQSKLLSVGVGSTFQWNKDGVPITGATNSTFSASQSGAYTVTVQIAGCTYTSGVVNILVDNLSVNAGSDFTKTCVSNPSGTAVGESSSSGFTYAWSPSAGLSSAAISNPVANPSSTTTYTLTKTNSATGCSSSDQVLVTVNTTLPTVNAGLDFTKTCVTNPSGTAVGESSSLGFTYAWSPISGLSSSTISNPIANPSSTTTYTLTKTNSTTGCTSSDQVLVTVNTTLPTVNAGLDFTKTCVSNPTGTAVGESSSSGFTYAWSPSAGLSSAAISNPVANPITTTTYTLTKTNSITGCSSSDQVLVTVDTTLPTVNAGSDFTKTCVSNPTGTAVGESSSSGFTYAWSPSAGLSSAAISNPVANPSSTTTYTLTKTNSITGCSSSDQVLVTVDTTLPTVNAGSDFTKTCVSNPTGTAVGESSSLGFTYAWSPSAGLSSAAISNPVANPSSTTTYTLTKTNSITGCSSSDQVLVTVDTTLPTVNAGSDFTKTCVSNPTGTAVGESSSLGFTYAWTPSAGLSSAAISNPVANPSSTTTYTLTKTNSITGCSSSDQVLVTVDTTLPTVNAGSDFTKTCVSNPTGTAVGESSSSGFTYAWSPSAGLSSAAISNPVANPSSTTTYTLTKTNSITGCSSSDQVLVTVDTTLPTVNAGSDFTKTCINNFSGAAIGETSASGNSYSWSPSTGLSASNISNPIANPTTNTTYTLTKTNSASGCISTDQVSVVVDNQPPVVDAGLDLTVCYGDVVTIFATGAPTFSWNNGVTDGVSFQPMSTDYFVVVGTNLNGCFSSDSLLITVQIATFYYNDQDSDGYGFGASIGLCTAPAGYVSNSTDCNDANASIKPGATETCNGVDDDCDTQIDEGVQTTFYADADGDTYGNLGVTTLGCTAPAGYVSNSTDCNDNNSSVTTLNIGTLSYTANSSNTGGIVSYAGGTTGVGVQWQISTNGGTTWSNTNPNQGSWYTINNPVVETRFQVIISSASCGSVLSNVVIVEVPGSGSTSAINLTTNNTYNYGPQTVIPVSIGANGSTWYKFTAQENAVRFALTSSTVGANTQMELYTSISGVLGPLMSGSEATENAQISNGNETLITDELNVQEVYFLKITDLSGVSTTGSMNFAYLRGSSQDIGLYTNYTNTYSNVCSNYKVTYRPGASYYTIRRYSSASAFGLGQSPTYSFTPNYTSTSANTVCQVGKLAVANLTTTPVQYFTTVDVTYNNLVNAAGVVEPGYVGVGRTVGTFTLNPEADVFVRQQDVCPVLKSKTNGSIITNRSVCGSTTYGWEFSNPNDLSSFTATGGLSSRILYLNTVPELTAGSTYGVKVRSNSVAQLSSAWGSSKCVQLSTVVAMPTIEDGGVIAERSENGVTTSIYPNPNNGQSVNFAVSGMEGELNVRIADATGREVYANRYIVEGSLNTTIDFGQTLAGGVYMVEMIQNGEMKTMRMAVSK